MPSKSPAQARLMAAVAHNTAFAKHVGISQQVGRDFNREDAMKRARVLLRGAKPKRATHT